MEKIKRYTCKVCGIHRVETKYRICDWCNENL